MSQGAAATETGIHRTGISDIERGRRVVGAIELVYLARAYGVSVNRLLGIWPGVRDEED
jgi:transcriptional regulator with XRE-family HTH domain